MNRFHPLLKVLSAILLTAGAFLCIAALSDAVSYWGQEPLGFSLGRAVPAVVLLPLSGAYAWVQAKRAFVAISIPFFVVSYGVIGLVLHTATRGAAKSFVPASESQVLVSYILFAASVLTVLIAGGAALAYVARRASCEADA